LWLISVEGGSVAPGRDTLPRKVIGIGMDSKSIAANAVELESPKFYYFCHEPGYYM
jgi:hypothetical protein